MKNFDHMFIDYLDSVNHLSIICDDLKKFTGFCTAGHLCLIDLPQKELSMSLARERKPNSFQFGWDLVGCLVVFDIHGDSSFSFLLCRILWAILTLAVLIS